MLANIVCKCLVPEDKLNYSEIYYVVTIDRQEENKLPINIYLINENNRDQLVGYLNENKPNICDDITDIINLDGKTIFSMDNNNSVERTQELGYVTNIHRVKENTYSVLRSPNALSLHT